MSLGFEQAGFDVVAAVEQDPAHAAAHRFNFPRCATLMADVAQLEAREILVAVRRGLAAHGRLAPRRPQVEVVFGGPPCPGFSIGGLRDASDPRNRLVERFVGLVEQLQPRAFVLENVPAMATRVLPGCRQTVPAWLRSRLSRSGYDVAPPFVLNASGFGVPQDRRRLLIVGVARGEPTPAAPPPRVAAPTRVPGGRPRPGELGHPSTDRRLPLGPTVADAIGDLPDVESFADLLDGESTTLDDAAVLLARALRSPYAAELAGDTRVSYDLSAARSHDPALLTASRRTVHSAATVARFEAVAPGDIDDVSRLYRLHAQGLSRTLRAGSTPDRGSFSAPRPIHPDLPRVASVRECARLHGFPDWFRFTAAKWHGARQIGNAVPPPLARAVAASLRDALDLPATLAAGPLEPVDPSLLLVASGAGRRPGARHVRPLAAPSGAG